MQQASRALHAASLALLLLGAASTTAAQTDSSPDDESSPREIGLEERAGTRLAQLDITVIGPADAITRLTPDDFKVKINFSNIREFQLDRICTPREPARKEKKDNKTEAGARDTAPLPGPAASYLFYFDQAFLTMEGRLRSLEVARTLVDRLVTETSQGMIVSNARETHIVQRLTSDRELLKSKLQQIENDRDEWVMYAQLEDERVRDVADALNWSSGIGASVLHGAISKARLYQKEERWFTDRNLRRLAVTLGQLVDLEPPKALIYFGDTVRSNPGEHYLSFFGEGMRKSEPTLSAMTADSLTGALAFDKVINAASAQGIRIYAIEARGLASPIDDARVQPLAVARTGSASSSSRVRITDTHRTLDDMAAETGGRSFLHGVRAAKIADRILDDSSCIYLLSFDPEGLPEDKPLPVRLSLERKDVDLRVRGRIVIQSESARRTSEILRAFSAPDSIPDPFVVKTGVVPTGFRNGTYSALLQISVPGSPLHGATWDLGGSLVADSKVRDKASGRLSTSAPNVPVIFEHEMNFKPGAYEIVAVAHEARSGLVASSETDIDWPQLKGGVPRVGPIVVLQPASGAFLRDGQTRGSGSLFVPDSDPVFTSRPAAFVGIVCRGKGRQSVRAERRLVGDRVHEFPDLELEIDEQPCAQVRDVIPSNTLTPGFYRYEIQLRQDDSIVEVGQREFVALDGLTGPSP